MKAVAQSGSGPSGSTFLDEHQAARVSALTLHQYRKAARGLCAYAHSVGKFPESADQWDDLLVEHKNASNLKRAQFAYVLAAVKFFHPRFRNALGWSEAVAAGWDRSHTTKHAVPLLSGHACLLATHLAAKGYSKLAGGCILQQRRGLRPSEMLGLMREDVSFSEHTGGGPGRVDLALGARSQTKSGRSQNISIYSDTDPDLCLFMHWVVESTPQYKLLFPHSIATYRRLLSKLDAELGINAGWTPHSPRAGFATESITNRVPFTEVRETMRHASDTSLRIYIDIVGAKAVALQLRTAGQGEALNFARIHWLKYVQPEFLSATYRGHHA